VILPPKKKKKAKKMTSDFFHVVGFFHDSPILFLQVGLFRVFL
jgi:hypothetical protein